VNFVVFEVSLAQMDNILVLNPVIGFFARSLSLRSCIID
jgi:hypothetical protein